jgi:16S rRNA (cytidine1402-2'-O)-methyltransferase
VKTVYSFHEAGPKLYICSTPIGNLEDVSQRLLETLKTVDVVAAEDTRQTRKLLSRYEIRVPELISYHEHNAFNRRAWLHNLWEQGKSIALVSDAGTPIVSDPGDDAVQQAIEAGVPVVPVPGPSALLAALVGSGLPAIPFTFVGFLPRGKKECRLALEQYGKLPWTFVFYEAPHRLVKTLSEVAELWPDRALVVAKELTKRHETFHFGTAGELLATLHEEAPRGEYVLVVGPPSASEQSEMDEADGKTELSLDDAVAAVHRLVSNGMSHKEAVAQVAKETGLRRKDLYNSSL